MALGNPLEALVVIGVASACVLDAVDMAIVMHHLVEQRCTDVFNGLASVPAPILISLLLPMTETHVSSLIEKCPYARGVD